MPTPAKVTEWLRNNDGNLTDAYKAVNYEGPPLKIKEGNLTDKRHIVRLAKRNGNGDSKRKAALKLRPPTTRDEQNRNRRQNYKRSSLSKQLGIPMVVDHLIDLGLLHDTVEDLDPKQKQARIKQLEQSYGPLGDRPDNRKIISSKQNGEKNGQTQSLQKHLNKMETKNPSFRLRAGLANTNRDEALPTMAESIGIRLLDVPGIPNFYI